MRFAVTPITLEYDYSRGSTILFGEDPVVESIQVTLLIPIKNGERYLASAFANLKAGARPGDEILVIDDNSEDFTFKLVEEWCGTDPRLRLLRNPGKGLVDALNYGISEAKGNWIARYDVDDNYSKDRIYKQVELISENVVAVFSDYNFSSTTGKHLGHIYSAVLPYATELSVLSAQRLAHPVALLRKTAVLQAGGYDKSEFPAEDLGLWLRLMELGSFGSVAERLLDYSLSDTSVSASKRDLIREKRERLLSNPTQVNLAIQNLNPTVMRIFDLYRKQDSYWERTLFYIRDLLIADSKKLLDKKQKKSLRISLIAVFFNPYTSILIFKHLYFKHLRAQIRVNDSASNKGSKDRR